MDPIAETSRWAAAVRALESEREDALFRDELARSFAGESGFARVDAEGGRARQNAYIALRTRFFDDWLLGLVDGEQVEQLVLLAAGMDARAFRLDLPRSLVLFELDRRAVLAHKEAVVTGESRQPRCERRLVPVDFERGDWPEQLGRSGFDRLRPTAWLAEGFFEYLQADAVDGVLGGLRESSGARHWLGTDFLSRAFVASPALKSAHRTAEAHATPWLFGTDHPEELLSRHGWDTVNVTQPGEPKANFGRWPWRVMPRQVAEVPRLFLVTAARHSIERSGVEQINGNDV